MITSGLRISAYVIVTGAEDISIRDNKWAADISIRDSYRSGRYQLRDNNEFHNTITYVIAFSGYARNQYISLRDNFHAKTSCERSIK